MRYKDDFYYDSKTNRIGYTAIVAWFIGVVVYFVLSSLSPIYMSGIPQIGATIPSLIVSSLCYIGIKYSVSKLRMRKLAH
jgi:purine-cytosine permease-like protein